MKKSIARQMSVAFIGLMLGLIAAYLLANNVFLEKFYELKKRNTLVGAYMQINEQVTDLEQVDETFAESFMEKARGESISYLVVDENYMQTWTNVQSNREATIMVATLNGYNLSIDGEEAKILKKTDLYTMQKKNDRMLKSSYLEIWGTLDSGYYCFLRIPLASIQSSADISNEFILYISLIALVLSVIMVAWMSRHITEPIKELTELAKRMANLDFDARYESGGDNEIGQLGRHFNQMSETLESTIAQLKTVNNELQSDIEKKTQIDEMRKEFLANVSHELKTPLALIQGYAEGLQECINDDEESRQFYCDVIIDEAGKMNNMVKKLLTLNQLESGADVVNMERFDLSQLIRGKVSSAQILAQQKGAQLIYTGEDNLHVWGDEFKVEEVLTNYVSNALNHVDGARRITIRTECREGHIRTTVENTGKCIPEEDLDKLWVKFYKVDKARTREYGGSGVGLSIVKAIMDSFHQAYGVYNTDTGVAFYFELENADKS